jgi:hypothetical protein
MNQKLFTASQIARSLGMNRRSVRRVLANVPPTGKVIVSGAPANAWTVRALPASLQELLTAKAQRLGLQTSEQLLSAPTGSWQPSVPLSQVAQHCLDKGAKLQRALAGILSLREDQTTAAADRERIGLDDYRKEFGHTITERHLQRLVARTRSRDGGAGAFGRLELYLDDNLARKHATKGGVPLSSNSEFLEFQAVVDAVKDVTAPTDSERAYLWLRALELCDERVAAGSKLKKVRLALLRALWACAPFLAKSTNALREAFRSKYNRWLQQDRDAVALADGRRDNSGYHRAPALPAEDRLLLTAEAAKLGGGIDQAWPMVLPRLSPQIRAHYSASRSCPKLIRQKICHDVVMAKIALHGENAMRTEGACVNRDPSGTASGDWDQSDDMTMVNVWWDDAPDSPEGFWFGQGQLLVWVDERSWFAYGYDLIPDPHYDAFSIRNSWNLKAETWGLPRKGLSLERGIWQTARVVVGEKVKRDSAVPLLETTSALGRLGLRFAHATHARVKVIERIYGKLQNYFQAAPGYVGRNPFTDRYQPVQDQIALVKSGKAHPSKFFLHKNQWASILDRVLVTYNDTPMHGKYHQGLSPKEAYETCFSSKLVHIPEEFSHLFKPETLERPVTKNGVRVRLGRREFKYKGARLGELRGQRVRVYFDPAHPEIARCTDLRGENSFTAELEARPFVHDPLPGTLEKALAQNAAQDRYMKELHRSLKPYYNSDFFSDINLFRPVLVDREAVEQAAEFSKQKSEVTARRNQEQRQQTKARKAFGRVGMFVDTGRPLRPGQAEHAERLLDLLNEEETT